MASSLSARPTYSAPPALIHLVFEGMTSLIQTVDG